MDINYLLSILDLYLLQEKDNALMVEVLDKENLVKINFSYTSSPLNKTFVKVDKNLFFDNLVFFLTKYQGNLEIENESLNNNIYSLIFNNKRKLSFLNFKVSELKEIRSKFKNLKTDFNFEIDESKKGNYIKSFDETFAELKKTSNLKFSMGFSSYITLFIIAIWFLDIFMIALWIFKGTMK